MSDEPSSAYVRVNGVRLHYLDWGGAGEPLLLVPGMGQSAHVFRELAPALAGAARVLALSPRAHGPSETPPDGYAVRDFAEEMAGFLDALGAGRAAVAGHSLSGPGVTHLAVHHPERVSRVVYLDGVHDRQAWARVQRANPLRPPHPPVGEEETDEEEAEWMRRHVYGFWGPALEADWGARPSRAESVRRRALYGEWLDDCIRHPPRYGELRAPALALVAAERVETVFPWLDGDEVARARAEGYLREVREPWRRGAVERFLREAPGARAVEIAGHHFLHLSHPGRVAAEVRAFLAEAGR